jgi:uncharacterized protein
MASSKKAFDAFGKILESSPYTVLDPVIKAAFNPRQNRLVLGGTPSGSTERDQIYLGKVNESCTTTNMLGADAWLDITFPHVIYITGTRGSGKSFDLGVLIEGISQLEEASPVQHDVEPVVSVLIDTQNQFWTLRYRPTPAVPENKEQLAALEKWKVPPNSLSNARIWIPTGSTKLLGTEEYFSLRPRDVPLHDWCALLGQDVYSAQGHILRSALARLHAADFDIADLIRDVERDANWIGIADSSRNAVLYKLHDYESTGFFSRSGLTFEDLISPGACNVFMLRELSDIDKSLVTAIVSRMLFQRMGDFHAKKKIAQFQSAAAPALPLPSRCWLLIDEAHVVAGKGQESPAREALIEYVKRGRDAGLSLVLATQQPSAVDDRILSQVNLSFNHRLTFQSDVASAISRIPTKPVSQMRSGGATIGEVGDILRCLDAGDCFVGDQATSRAILVKIRPRMTAHGGYSPSR